MRISLCGAAQEVTGSGYLVETATARVLVDFGMFQGSRRAEARNATVAPVNPLSLDAVVATHAHLDHTGRLPLLPARGFRGLIHATPATVDIAQLVLADSARLQQADAARRSRRLLRAGRRRSIRSMGQRRSRPWRLFSRRCPITSDARSLMASKSGSLTPATSSGHRASR